MRTVNTAMLALLAVAQALGCGGESRTTGDRAAGGHGGQNPTGGAGSGGVPTKNGVPIGDCKDPTPAEQAARGCPETQPAGRPCDTPGLVCRYEINAQGMTSFQTVYSCVDGSWGTGSALACGLFCNQNAANVVELNVSDCASRPLVDCDDGSVIYAFPMPAQILLDDAFRRALIACSADVVNNEVQVVLSDGCASRLTSMSTLTDAQLSCLRQSLGSMRWSCGSQLACGTYAAYLL